VNPGTIPEATAPTISDEQYGNEVVQELSNRYRIDYGNPKMDKIEEIVQRLTKAARAEQHPWHFYLFKDDAMKNAAATRGNYLFIWTGMLESTRTDGELAAVLAHEIAHVIAGHTAPDPNQEVKRILIQALGVAAGIATNVAIASATRSPNMSVNLGGITQDLTTSIGEGILVNPYSREKEHEADQIGLELMAEAKYDPQEAINFWERAVNDPAFSSSLAFLSTHPPAPDRLARLKSVLPFAVARYQGSQLPAATSSSPPDAMVIKPDLYAAPVASPEPPSGSGDSFDISGSSSTRSVTPAPSPPSRREIKSLPWADEWRVIADRAVLFDEPTTSSIAVGEFRKGAVVRSSGRREGWLRIQRPDHGFIRESDVVPVYSGKR
jgi:Zn-dependent protease with chaperone function